MSKGTVHLGVSGQVATITIARASAHNSLTWPMYESLGEICDRIRHLPNVRVAILQGAGDRAFCAGSDIHQFADFTQGDDGLAYESRMERILYGLETLPIPTVAAIDGMTLGGGLLLALVCDIRLATPQSTFGVPIAKTLGNCLSARNYSRIVDVLGAARTKELVFTGTTIGAEEAARVGLISRVVEAKALAVSVTDVCNDIVRNAPQTIMATKEIIHRLSDSSVRDSDVLYSVYDSKGFREGVASFVGGRSPGWPEFSSDW